MIDCLASCRFTYQKQAFRSIPLNEIYVGFTCCTMSFLSDSETASQLLARLTGKGEVLLLPKPFFGGCIFPGEICEICFDENTPLMDLIGDLISSVLINGSDSLPPDTSADFWSESSCRASYNLIYLDFADMLQPAFVKLAAKLDNLFAASLKKNPSASAGVLDSCLSNSLSQECTRIAEVLERLYYVHCCEPSDFVHAVDHVEALLLSLSGPCVLLIDSLTSLCWSCDPYPLVSTAYAKHNNHLLAFIESVKKLSMDHKHRLVVFATQLALPRNILKSAGETLEAETSTAGAYSALPSAWQKLISRSLYLRFEHSSLTGSVSYCKMGIFGSSNVHVFHLKENSLKFVRMDELRKYWRVPAIAHFCSLFKTVFKLVDFDIEDFEEALIVDTETAVEGGRSSLIVDLLIALLRGCFGRKEDISLLNYNQCLYDFLQIYWVAAGCGNHPLGENREKCCFHILPLCAKVKILHLLCENRLERPDVENLTRNLTGDSLRIHPLGHDDSGTTYWYFYGTRLYKEDPEPVKLKISLEPKKPKGASTPRKASGRRRRKRRGGASYNKRKPVKKAKLDEESESDNDKLEETKADDDDSSNDEASAEDESSRQNASASGMDESEPDGEGRKRSFRHAYETRAKTENESLGKFVGRRLLASKADIKDDDMEALVNRIYSRDDDDDSSVPNSRLLTPTPRASEDTHEDSKPQSPGPSISETPFTAERSAGGSDMPEHTRVAEVSDDVNDDKNHVKLEDIDLGDPNTHSSCVAVAEDQNGGGDAADVAPTKIEEVSSYSEATKALLRRPHIPEGPPPWTQPGLIPTEEDERWHLLCSTLDDWRQLARKYQASTSSEELEFHQILNEEFLPAIELLFQQKEKEKQKRLLEMAPRRISDRIEEKKAKREQEAHLLSEREFEEIERQTRLESEKRQKLIREQREQRAREREKEREKKMAALQKAKDERSRRLDLRKQRQELMAAGQEIPPELMSATSSALFDKELNDLEKEIEFDHTCGQLEKLLDSVKAGEDSWPFLEPVTEEIAPDYFKIVEEPTDLTTIENNLFERKYKSKKEFIQDVNKMLLNCLLYNGMHSEYTKVGQRFERTFIRLYKKQFPPWLLEDADEAEYQEEVDCQALLGALDRRIKFQIYEESGGRQSASEHARQKSKRDDFTKRKRHGADLPADTIGNPRREYYDEDIVRSVISAARSDYQKSTGGQSSSVSPFHAFATHSSASKPRILQSYPRQSAPAPRFSYSVTSVSNRPSLPAEGTVQLATSGLVYRVSQPAVQYPQQQRQFHQYPQQQQQQPKALQPRPGISVMPTPAASSGAVQQQSNAAVTAVLGSSADAPGGSATKPQIFIARGNPGQPQKIMITNVPKGTVVTKESIERLLGYLREQQILPQDAVQMAAVEQPTQSQAAAFTKIKPAPTQHTMPQLTCSSSSSTIQKPILLSSLPSSLSSASSSSSGAAASPQSGPVSVPGTVIPLPNGKHFVMRDRDGQVILLEKDATSGDLRSVCKISEEFQERFGINRLLSSTGVAVSSPSTPQQLLQLMSTTSAIPFGNSKAADSSAGSAHSTAALLDHCFGTLAASSDARPTPSPSATLLLSKPVCSVAPYRQPTQDQQRQQQPHAPISASAAAAQGTSAPSLAPARRLQSSPEKVVIVQQPLLLLSSGAASAVGANNNIASTQYVLSSSGGAQTAIGSPAQFIRLNNQPIMLSGTSVSGGSGNAASLQLIHVMPQIVVNASQPMLLQHGVSGEPNIVTSHNAMQSQYATVPQASVCVTSSATGNEHTLGNMTNDSPDNVSANTAAGSSGGDLLSQAWNSSLTDQ